MAEGSKSPATWLVPLVVVAGLLAWLLLGDGEGEASPEPTEAERSAEEEVDPTFHYDVR